MTIRHSGHQRFLARGNLCWGRPVTETVMLVNMGNQPHCDYGEGLAMCLPLTLCVSRRAHELSQLY
jgi:hypothetical protein